MTGSAVRQQPGDDAAAELSRCRDLGHQLVRRAEMGGFEHVAQMLVIDRQPPHFIGEGVLDRRHQFFEPPPPV